MVAAAQRGRAPARRRRPCAAVAVIGPNAARGPHPGRRQRHGLPAARRSPRSTACAAALGDGRRGRARPGGAHRPGRRLRHEPALLRDRCRASRRRLTYVGADGADARRASTAAPARDLAGVDRAWSTTPRRPRRRGACSPRRRTAPGGSAPAASAAAPARRWTASGRRETEARARRPASRHRRASSRRRRPATEVALGAGRDGGRRDPRRPAGASNGRWRRRAVASSRPSPRPGRRGDRPRRSRSPRSCDAAVVVVGTTEEVESEGFDRTALALPGAAGRARPRRRRREPEHGRRRQLRRPGAAAVARTRCQPCSWRGSRGQQFGAALADVLSARASRAAGCRRRGRRRADVARSRDDPVDGVVEYAEGLDIGYRAAPPGQRRRTAPAYWFGHGLGYTTWEHDACRSSPRRPTARAYAVRVQVRNTRHRAGADVVQAYLSRPDSAVARPPLWLAGFAVGRGRPRRAGRGGRRASPRGPSSTGTRPPTVRHRARRLRTERRGVVRGPARSPLGGRHGLGGTAARRTRSGCRPGSTCHLVEHPLLPASRMQVRRRSAPAGCVV